jgi:hypothetical protein
VSQGQKINQDLCLHPAQCTDEVDLTRITDLPNRRILIFCTRCHRTLEDVLVPHGRVLVR